jgi:phage N-6-adenine-methyltransferase
MSDRNLVKETVLYKVVEKGERAINPTLPQHPTEIPILGGVEPRNSILFSSKSEEWNTPPAIVNRTKSVLGTIELDPCWNSESPVRADRVYTKQDDGLVHPWEGKIYMNPPYGREVVKWVDKLLAEYRAQRTTEAVVLIPARTDTKWFHKFRDFPVCCIKGRLRFSESKNAATFPSAVIYLGDHEDRFAEVFGEIGIVYKRWA